MNASEVRIVLLVRAFEAPIEAPWTQADAEAATREAAREIGESGSAEHFISRRAAIAASRLADRDNVVSTVLRIGAPLGASALMFAVAFAFAFAFGYAGDSIAGSGRVDILAPPLLVLIAWNLAVYAVLLVAWVRRKRRPMEAKAVHPLRSMLMDPFQRWLATPRRVTGALLRFTHDWSNAVRPVQMHRIGALLHAGAIAFACGALASLYLRGLVFEYRAGWGSTFLTPNAVHAWLSLMLGPASALTGIGLPTPDRLAQLRFSSGDGENAALWIHLYAVTVAALVIWPRGWLAAAAMRRARRLASNLPVDLRGTYFQRLLRGRGTARFSVRLIVYGQSPDATMLDRLTRKIEQAAGRQTAMSPIERAPDSANDGADEHDISRLTDDDDGSTLFVLFNLASTPERETHGRFLDALRRSLPDAHRAVLVDETSFRQRFAATMPNRIVERREAWSRMLRDVGREPVFIDLSSEAISTSDTDLSTLFDPAT